MKIKIGSMYRNTESWKLYSAPYRENHNPNRKDCGRLEPNSICQIIDINEEHPYYAVLVLSGMQLGWVTFYEKNYALKTFIEITEESYEKEKKILQNDITNNHEI